MIRHAGREQSFRRREIGISIGGNKDEPGRFASSIIRNNVMSDIGRSQPTGRTLAWGIEVKDNDGLEISGNYFLNQRQSGVSNSYSIDISNDENAVSVTANLFYRIQGRSLSLRETDGHQNMEISENTFVDPDQNSWPHRAHRLVLGLHVLGQRVQELGFGELLVLRRRRRFARGVEERERRVGRSSGRRILASRIRAQRGDLRRVARTRGEPRRLHRGGPAAESSELRSTAHGERAERLHPLWV